MSITPEDIAAQTFPLALRGYRVEAVDDFLDRLQAELGQAHPAPALEAPAADLATDPAGEGHGTHAARALRTLVRAEQMAEEVLAEATAEADRTRARSQVEAREIVAAAHAESGRIDAELRLRQEREVGALAEQAHRLRTEIDRLGHLERRYHEALQALLSEQQELLAQRLPVLDDGTAAKAAPPDDGLRPAA
ncbi:MAG: DivIVA protein [Frankiales bacterium]|nr:DivIVA protein [Frankiales bacterium]